MISAQIATLALASAGGLAFGEERAVPGVSLEVTASLDTGSPRTEGGDHDVGSRNMLEPIQTINARLSAVEQRLESLEAQALREPTRPLPTSAAETVVVQSGEVVDDAISLTGPLDVYGTVEGNAISLASDVRIHSGGHVRGDVVTLGGQIEVANDAEVLGDQISLGSQATQTSWRQLAASTLSDMGINTQSGDDVLQGWIRRISAMLSMAAAGILVVGFFPAGVDRVASRIVERPIWHGLIGIAVTPLLALLTAVLAVTIIGIPISLMLGLVIVASGIFGSVALAHAAGRQFPGIAERGVWLTFLIGGGLMATLSTIPWVGPSLMVCAMIPASGASYAHWFGRNNDQL